MDQGGSKCPFLAFVLGLGLLLDELVEKGKKPQLEADFGYQTVFNTWRGICGRALQGRPILQNTLSVWISSVQSFNVSLLAKYNSASHLLINQLPHWAC